jgi:hypothetical protein
LRSDSCAALRRQSATSNAIGVGSSWSLERHLDTGLKLELVAMARQRGHEPEVLQAVRIQIVRKAAHGVREGHRQVLQGHDRCVQRSGILCGETAPECTQLQRDAGDLLTDRVVQVARHTAPFGFLVRDQARNERVQVT